MPGSCATKKNLQRGRKYQTKESLSVTPFKWNITLNLPVTHRGFLVHARVECTYQGKPRKTTHREPIPLRPSLPNKWVRSFFLFFQFFPQTRAEMLTIQTISGKSGKFSNRLWGHDWKFESLIPSKALYQNQHYVIPRIFGLNVIHICTNSWPIFMPDFLFFFYYYL